MNQMKFLIYPSILLLATLSGCEYNNPLDEEQYTKQVYIVGANQSNNEGLLVVELPYMKSETEEVETDISVGTGGSQNIDKDISVTLSDAGNEAISNYNYLYLYKADDIRYQSLNSLFFRIPDNTVKIKSGEIYGKMPVYIKTAGLKCDSLYAMTFKIASVSDPDYVTIRKTDTVLMFSFSLVNNYSGSYKEVGTYCKVPSVKSEDTVSLSSPRILKAVNYNTVRLIHLANTENTANVAAFGVTVKIEDNNTLTVTPWGSLALTAGGGTYDPVAGVFNLWYNYTSGGVNYKFSGQFIKSST